MKILVPWLVAALMIGSSVTEAATPENERVVNSFVQLVTGDDDYAERAFAYLDDHWQPGFAAMALDVLSVAGSSERSVRLWSMLEDKTQHAGGRNVSDWYQWLWNRPEALHPAYGDFKSALYALIDPAFRAYFSSDRKAEIRLDEIRWGGVRQDGIPPLRNPKMLRADEADYLDDSNIVFGLEVNADARAYPKRILAWHEMFVDRVGGVDVAGVYCTLCGTMILYRTTYDGTKHDLGTSGFLYRSNKLMYDRATQSLWNTIWGTPVVGPLAGRGIELERGSVVTTTWGEWKRRHPNTQVLSLETGYDRDYSEGAAYRDYFATDALMFGVPRLDTRLKNKDEVFVLRPDTGSEPPVAFASEYLERNTLHHDRVGAVDVVIITDSSGAHRAYVAGDTRFEEWDGSTSLVDEDGAQWSLEESRLYTADGRELERYPAHRAFWFGWYSAYPNTRLVR
jgi:hypothetical protein